MAEMGGYAIDLRTMIQARDSFPLSFDGYEEVPKANQAKIIEDTKKDNEQSQYFKRRSDMPHRFFAQNVNPQNVQGMVFDNVSL